MSLGNHLFRVKSQRSRSRGTKTVRRGFCTLVSADFCCSHGKKLVIKSRRRWLIGQAKYEAINQLEDTCCVDIFCGKTKTQLLHRRPVKVHCTRSHAYTAWQIILSSRNNVQSMSYCISASKGHKQHLISRWCHWLLERTMQQFRSNLFICL